MECTGLSLSRRSHFGPDRGNHAGHRANLTIRNKSSKSRMIAFSLAWVLAFVLQLTTVRVPGAGAASGLKLAPQLSFDDDSSPNFPIQVEIVSERSIASREATALFFRTSNCFTPSHQHHP